MKNRGDILEYPEAFKERCRRAITHWDRLEDALKKGSDLVGRVLDDSRHITMKEIRAIREVLLAGNADEALKICDQLIEFDVLYRQWLKLYRSQKK